MMNRRASLRAEPKFESLETYTMKGGIKVIERFFILPLDYSNPSGESIRVFARNLVPLDKAKTKEDEEKLPYIVYLAGGPGFEVGFPVLEGYASLLHEKGYQTLWLDQRGTGLSSPISASTIPPAYASSPRKTADYLKFFRADSIVKDCEQIRGMLLSDKEKEEDRKWSLLGQSFGGWCALNYLSQYGEGLKEVFLTGGLAPLTSNPDLTYEASILQVIKRNKVYYEKYPRDLQRIRSLFAHLESNKVIMPNGGRLSVKRFQQLGLEFGMTGGIDRIHQLVFRASNDLDTFDKISYKTLQLIQDMQSFDGNPLFAILHEPIYCQGQAPRWSASRVIEKYPQFSWEHVKNLTDLQPVYFTGEMIIPEMFDDYAELRPLKEAAEILAHDADWPALYNIEQLARNEVKVNAATYYDDMYVPFELAQDTAERVGNVEQFITNQLNHDGLRLEGKDVLAKLFEISKRERN
ncbi:alpha/beta-hydrolase, partial [Flagelloscypha sp. PMI_526]